MGSTGGNPMSHKRRRFIIRAGLASIAAPAILASTTGIAAAAEAGPDADPDLSVQIELLNTQLEIAQAQGERLEELIQALLILLGAVEVDESVSDSDQPPDSEEGALDVLDDGATLDDVIAELKSELGLEPEADDTTGSSVPPAADSEPAGTPEPSPTPSPTAETEPASPEESPESPESAESPELQESAESDEESG